MYPTSTFDSIAIKNGKIGFKNTEISQNHSFHALDDPFWKIGDPLKQWDPTKYFLSPHLSNIDEIYQHMVSFSI
jgi:hypothetical protein